MEGLPDDATSHLVDVVQAQLAVPAAAVAQAVAGPVAQGHRNAEPDNYKYRVKMKTYIYIYIHVYLFFKQLKNRTKKSVQLVSPRSNHTDHSAAATERCRPDLQKYAVAELPARTASARRCSTNPPKDWCNATLRRISGCLPSWLLRAPGHTCIKHI